MTQNESESKSNRIIFMNGSYIGILEAWNKEGKLKFETQILIEYSIVSWIWLKLKLSPKFVLKKIVQRIWQKVILKIF